MFPALLLSGCGSASKTITSPNFPFFEQSGDIKNLPVTALTFSNDSKKLFSALSINAGARVPKDRKNLSGGKVIAWDLEENRQIAEFVTQQWPTSMAMSADGQQLIVGCGSCRYFGDDRADFSTRFVHSRTGRLVILNPRRLTVLRRIELPWSVYCLAISPDNKLLVAQGANRDGDLFVRFWRLDDWTVVGEQQLEGAPAGLVGIGPIRSLAFSPDGKWLLVATVSSDQPIDKEQEQDPVTFSNGKVKQRRKEHLRLGEVAIIDVEQLKIVNRMCFNAGPVTFLDISPDGKKLSYTAGETSGIADIALPKSSLGFSRQNMHANSATLFHSLDTNRIIRCAVMPFGRIENYITAGLLQCRTASQKDNEWKTKMTIHRVKPDLAYGRSYSTAISPDGKSLAIGYEFGSFCAWRLPK